MAAITLIVFITFILVIIYLYDKKTLKRREHNWIRNNFGAIPKQTDLPMEQIQLYWEEFGDRLDENETIDEITWNDLEMDIIFGRINNCVSFAGEQVLFDRLHQLPQTVNQQTDKNSNTEQYELDLESDIAYFSTFTKDREEVQSQLFKIGKEEVFYNLPVSINNLDILGIANIWFYKLMQALLLITSLVTIVFYALSIKGAVIPLTITIFIFFFNIVIYAYKKSEHELYMDTMSGIIRLIKVAKSLIQNTKETKYTTPFHVKENLKQFDSITRMIGTLQKKKQATLSGDIIDLLRDYIIGATLWDFTNYDKIIRNLQGKQEKFMEIYEYIGSLDMAISIASFRKSLPLYCAPTFTKDKTVKMTDVYHPLIHNPIYNTVTVDQNSIITGSNASGKSTFIKSVAINSILAQNIHTCMAKQFILPRSRVITSMAIRDDIMTGESYYIKEIKYLNRIIQSLSEERIVICVIDEILRGTNTQERIAASVAVLQYLIDKNCLAVVASHDIELTKILENRYNFYYFSEKLNEKDISFEYKIHEGVSNTKNAINLLEFVGFPKVIVSNAKHMYRQEIIK